MRRLRKLLVADSKSFLRDRASLFWTLFFPIFFILIFGAIFSNEDVNRFNVGLVVEDTSPGIDRLAQGFEQVPIFKVVRGDRAHEMDQLKNGKRRAVIVLAEGLGAGMAQGAGKIQVYYDASQTMASQTMLTVMNQVVDRMNQAITSRPDVLALDAQSMQTHHMRYIDFFVPGVLGMALMQLGIFGAAGIVVAREKQILKRLWATPLPRRTLIASQIILRLVIAVVQALIIVFVGRAVYHVQVLGNWGALFGLVFLGALMFTALGFTIASFARTQETAIAAAQVVNFPMMFLSGIFFPIESMPSFLQPVVRVFPLTYLGDALRQVMAAGSQQYPMQLDVAILGGWFIVCFLIAMRFFKWE